MIYVDSIWHGAVMLIALALFLLLGALVALALGKAGRARDLALMALGVLEHGRGRTARRPDLAGTARRRARGRLGRAERREARRDADGLGDPAVTDDDRDRTHADRGVAESATAWAEGRLKASQPVDPVTAEPCVDCLDQGRAEFLVRIPGEEHPRVFMRPAAALLFVQIWNRAALLAFFLHAATPELDVAPIRRVA